MVKPIVESMRRRFSIAVAEVGYQDKWQRAELGVAVVSGSAGHATEVLEGVERWIWSHPEVEVCVFETAWLDESRWSDA